MATSTSHLKYDVFLSFRGTDTRKKFVAHLYKALKNAGVGTFRDDDEIERGKNIMSELQNAIRQSKMSIIVFSEDYTSSTACLKEVEAIYQYNKTSEHSILPIFYHVEPAELKKQARDLAAQEGKEKYSVALKEVASIAGMPLKDENEAVFIEEIVEMVQGNLIPKVLTVGYHLVGMDSRVKKIELWLRSDSANDVRMLVICGMGGLGKTTTAKSVFNLNYRRFDGSSFLGNIREASKIPRGLLRLQRQLLSDIQKKPEKKVDNIDDGLRRIQYVLKNKRILLVLDDVDEVDQLQAIVGMRNSWFTLGSKIIITSRREDFLKAGEDYAVHRIEKLDDEESLELFSMHAFGETHPPAGFVEHSKRFVSHCQGLPLALEVLGSSVCRKNLKVWDSALASLEVIPETKIIEKLKISYDSLDNKKVQDLFLDIACFFVGRDKNDTISILDGCDYYTELGIQKLADRNLLSVGENNKLGMHQLLQDMGRQVVREESTRPEERSRLWRHNESFNILRNKTGSAKAEGLVFDMKMLKKNKIAARNIHRRPTFFPYWIYPIWTDQNDELLETISFKGMYNLRLLELSYVKLSGSYAEFPPNLRLMCLRGFHLKSLPNGFPLENIVSLDLRNSNLTQVWKETKVLETLKILNLSHSHQLAKTPNFLTIPNLEKLILKDCPCLNEIDESIVVLERLIFLNLKDCKTLRKLPRNLYLVKSLEQLIISGCSNLVGVAEELANMDSLQRLFADRMSINQLLSTPGEVAQRYLLPWLTKPMKNPETTWVSLPRSLVTLSLTDSNLSDDAFPKDFGNLPLLEDLNLTGNPICRLPNFIRKLGRLEKLNLSWCRSLEQIEWPEVNVKELILTECRSLQRITYETWVGPKSISHGACMSLNYVERGFKIELMKNVDASVLESIGFCDFEINKNVEVFIANGIVWSRKKLPIQVIYEARVFSTYIRGKEVPSCFANKSTSGSKVSFTIPSTSSPKIRGLNTCLVYTLPTDIEWLKDPISVKISNKSKGVDRTYTPRCFGVPDADEDLIWISHWFRGFWGFLFEKGDEVEVCFSMNVHGEIKECGVNVLYYEEGGVAEYYNALFSSWDSRMDLFYPILKCLDDHGGLSVKGKNSVVIRFIDDCDVPVDGGGQEEEDNYDSGGGEGGGREEEEEEEEEKEEEKEKKCVRIVVKMK